MVDMTALPLVGRSMRQFAWADAKATARTAVRAFAWTTGAVGLALFAAAVLNPSRVEPLTVASAIATLVGALVYAALPGLVVATCAAVFRLAGGWAFLPLLVLTCIVTLPPLFWAIARRTAWRYAKHVALG